MRSAVQVLARIFHINGKMAQVFDDDLAGQSGVAAGTTRRNNEPLSLRKYGSEPSRQVPNVAIVIERPLDGGWLLEDFLEHEATLVFSYSLIGNAHIYRAMPFKLSFTFCSQGLTFQPDSRTLSVSPKYERGTAADRTTDSPGMSSR